MFGLTNIVLSNISLDYLHPDKVDSDNQRVEHQNSENENIPGAKNETRLSPLIVSFSSGFASGLSLLALIRARRVPVACLLLGALSTANEYGSKIVNDHFN